jgi:hypothetical protein
MKTPTGIYFNVVMPPRSQATPELLQHDPIQNSRQK